MLQNLSSNLLLPLFFLSLVSWHSAKANSDKEKEDKAVPIKVLLPPPPLHFDDNIPASLKNQLLYIGKLVTAVLEACGQPYEIIPTEVDFKSVEHLTADVKQGKLSLTILNTDTHWEERLRPIRYPVYKGLIGWRLFLIRPEMQKQFAQIQSIDELKKMIAGQGYHWPDTTILKENGFKLREAMDFQALTNLLNNGYIDYFPRGIFEIGPEHTTLQKEGGEGGKLVIEQHLALNYPAALNFFTARENEALAKALENGFKVINKNGTWDKLFQEHYAHVIAAANLSNRKIFKLERKHLPDYMKNTEPGVWYMPAN